MSATSLDLEALRITFSRPGADSWREIVRVGSLVLRRKDAFAEIRRSHVLLLLANLANWPPEIDRKVPKTWPEDWRAVAERRVREISTYGRYEVEVCGDPRLRTADGLQGVNLKRRFVGLVRTLADRPMNVGTEGEPDLQGDLIIDLPGGPGVAGIRIAWALEVEVKSTDGRLSSEQSDRARAALVRGRIHVVVRSVEECVTKLVEQRDRLVRLLSSRS